MKHSTTMAAEETPDSELVARTMAGDREAFGQIVSRHQTLVCSLAYNATGHVAQSEDLAQEIFVTAWRELRQLREPEKLRGWLCGIARNTIRNRFRSLRREPAHGAAELDEVAEIPAAEPLPSDLAVTREREEILWSALRRIPEIYREPLILFYRQHQSVERVAADLGLGEDVVRQRLSRGRKLLQEQVALFVEGMLARTTPGTMFTTAVIGSLPLLASAGAASAAGLGGAATKGGAATLGLPLLTVFNFVLGPLLAIFASFVGVRASMKALRTDRERAYMKRYFRRIVFGTVVATAISTFAPLSLAIWPGLMSVNAAVLTSVGTTVLLAVGVATLAFRAKREMAVMRVEEMQLHPEAFAAGDEAPCGPFKEYRSRWSFLGLPLVHVRLGSPMKDKTCAAVGWIAIGDAAVGLVAIGGITFGGLSIGGISLGLFAIGGVGAGLMAVGALACGGLAIGGISFGWVAVGFSAFGWLAAQGWYAVAQEFAVGRLVAAAHANDAAAEAWFAARSWFDFRTGGGKSLLALAWLPTLLLLAQYRRTWLPRRRRWKKDGAL